MPTSKTRKRRRTRVAGGAAAAIPRDAVVASGDGEGGGSSKRRAAASKTPGEPWSRRSMAVMMLIVCVMQLPFGLLHYASDRTSDLFENVILVPAVFPPLLLLAGCFFAMPIARRIAHEARGMGVAETLSVGLTVVVLFLSFATVGAGGSVSTQSGTSTPSSSPLPTPVTGTTTPPKLAGSPSPSPSGSPAVSSSPKPSGTSSQPAKPTRLTPGQLTALTGANLFAFAVTAYLFPSIYRLIWLRGRRDRPSGAGAAGQWWSRFRGR